MDEAFDAGRFGPTPRTITAGMAASIVMGNWASHLGWLFVGLGSFFFWSMVWHADFSGWRFSPGQVAETRGDSLGCMKTRYSEGGSRYRRGTPIYENRYRYEAEGRDLEGSSFAKGKCLASGTVTVEYLRAQPQVSRITGMRRRPYSFWTALVMVIPAGGLILLVAGVMIGRTHLRLLRDGLMAPGRLVDKIRTNGRTNNRQVYKMVYEYPAPGGVGRTSMRTNRPERLETESPQTVIYDPATPGRAALLASLPVKIATGELGRPALRASKVGFVLPALTILGNGLYVYHLIGR